MVLLSVAVLNTKGSSTSVVVARQYLEVSKEEIEGLLGGFGMLTNSGGLANEANFLETSACRYLYQPLGENLFLVLVTTKHSNVLEDLDTLRLLYRVTVDVVSTASTANSSQHVYQQKAFDLIFAFDEVITFGRREAATLAQVKAGLDMDSHEERLHLLIEKSKENEAKETAKRKQAEFARLRAEQAKSAAASAVSGSGAGSAGMEPGMTDDISHFGQPVDHGHFRSLPNRELASMPSLPSLPTQPALTPWTPGVSEGGGVTKTLGAAGGKKGMSLSSRARPGTTNNF